MRTIRGEYLILIGFVLVMLGAILPFLMVMRILKSTFFLNFFSYGASVAGLFLGIIGCAYLVRYYRRKNKIPSEPHEITSDDHQDW
jgi:positive regulator of sigma E activity